MPGTLIVSLDFELFWGMHDVTTVEAYYDHVIGARKAIPRLLELFKRHGIHATWATVGFMFAEDENDLEKYLPEGSKLPTYTNTELSGYRCIKDIKKDPRLREIYFSPEIIKQVSEAENQEIASHTFSHYYCLEDGQTPEQFKEDMVCAKKIAEDKGYSLTSVILPRNQCKKEYIKILTDLGFIAYRDEENDWIHEKVKIRPLMRLLRLADVYFPLTGKGGYVPKDEDGIINLIGSRMYKPIFKKLKFMEGLKIRRIKKQMLNAAKKGLTFHLWWHPHNIGIMRSEHLKQLEEIFSYYDELKEKYGMRSLNMKEAAEEVKLG